MNRCLACECTGAEWQEIGAPSRRFCDETCQDGFYTKLEAKKGRKKKAAIPTRGQEEARITKPDGPPPLDLVAAQEEAEAEEARQEALARRKNSPSPKKKAVVAAAMAQSRLNVDLVKAKFFSMKRRTPEQLEAIEREAAADIIEAYPNYATQYGEFGEILTLARDGVLREAVLKFILAPMRTMPENTPLSDHLLWMLPNLTSLSLNSGNTGVTGVTFATQTNLTELYLMENDSVSNGHLALATHLTHLSLQDNWRIRDEGIATLTNLRSLNLTENGTITGAVLRGLPRLRVLSLRQNGAVTDRHLRKLTALRELGLGSNQLITNTGTRPLVNLRVLDLTMNDRISEEGIWDAIYMKQLYYNANGIWSVMSQEKHLTLLQHWKNRLESAYIGSRLALKEARGEMVSEISQSDDDDDALLSQQ